jgi:hypothetical protein
MRLRMKMIHARRELRSDGQRFDSLAGDNFRKLFAARTKPRAQNGS